MMPVLVWTAGPMYTTAIEVEATECCDPTRVDGAWSTNVEACGGQGTQTVSTDARVHLVGCTWVPAWVAVVVKGR